MGANHDAVSGCGKVSFPASIAMQLRSHSPKGDQRLLLCFWLSKLKTRWTVHLGYPVVYCRLLHRKRFANKGFVLISVVFTVVHLAADIREQYSLLPYHVTRKCGRDHCKDFYRGYFSGGDTNEATTPFGRHLLAHYPVLGVASHAFGSARSRSDDHSESFRNSHRQHGRGRGPSHGHHFRRGQRSCPHREDRHGRRLQRPFASPRHVQPEGRSEGFPGLRTEPTYRHCRRGEAHGRKEQHLRYAGANRLPCGLDQQHQTVPAQRNSHQKDRQTDDRSHPCA